MRRLLKQVPDHVLVVVDEAYIEFATRPDFPDLLPDLRGGRSNILLLRTFAKMHGLAGLRLGYAFGHPDVLDYLHRARPVFNVNALAQAAGVAAVEDTEHITRSRAYAEECRALFARELAALGLHPIPSETNFIAVDVADDAAVAEELRERGYTVTPLSGWGVPGCIRVSFGTTEQNQGFLAALRDTLAQISAPDA
jgi:histidinol-phosphate aminotransferase